MSQTPAGIEQLKKTNIAKYGSEEAWKEHMRSIGARGGRLGSSGGFASSKVGPDGLTGRERARHAGSVGGRISRRAKKTEA